MVKRGELTDKAWEQIAPLLPENGRRGKATGQTVARPPRDHKRHLVEAENRLALARPLPEERYGPWQTCYDRFARWRGDGTWDRLLVHVQTK